MTQDKTGHDATPRIGLDLGRQIVDDPSGRQKDQSSGASEESIRQRAYEIWERDGRAGDPHDHWYRAERELHASQPERSFATVENAPPAAAAEEGGRECTAYRRRSHSEETSTQAHLLELMPNFGVLSHSFVSLPDVERSATGADTFFIFQSWMDAPAGAGPVPLRLFPGRVQEEEDQFPCRRPASRQLSCSHGARQRVRLQSIG